MHRNFRKLKILIRNNLNNIKTIAIEKFFELPLLEKPFPNDIFGKKPLKTKKHYLDLHKKALKNQAKMKKMKLHLQNCSSWSISHS